MLYFTPRLAYDPFSPPQDRLQDKFGGLPWGFPLSRWPTCKHCDEPQALIAQLTHSESLDLGRSGRVLHVFQCRDWWENGCDAFDADSGANSCFLLDEVEMGKGLTPPPSPSGLPRVEARVLEWVSKDDGIDPGLYEDFFDESAWLHFSTEEVTSRVHHGTKVGGFPSWCNGPQCALSGSMEGWRFVLQISQFVSFEGPLPEADDIGCRVVRQRNIWQDGQFVRTELVSVTEPKVRKAGPEYISSKEGEDCWSTSVANFGMGMGYVFLPKNPERLDGAFTWQR